MSNRRMALDDEQRPGAIGNVVAYQLGWGACVAGAWLGVPAAGVVLAAAVLSWQVRLAPSPGRMLGVVALTTVLGGLWETILLASGLTAYPGPGSGASLVPAWMLMLWSLFGSTLDVSLRWLQTRPWLAAGLGAAGGPLAYSGGERLGVLSLEPPALWVLAIGWAVLTPVLLAAARTVMARPVAVRSVRRGR